MITPTEHKSLSIGPCLLARKFFTYLNLTPIFSPLKKRGIDAAALTEGLIAYKLTENFSVKQAHTWFMQPEIREFYQVDEFENRTIYRILETIGENSAEIIDAVQDRIFSCYHFDTTDINLDWTSIVLHGEASPLGAFGYSRDHRPDKQQITLGIAELTKPNNIPIGVTVKAGNINDMTHFSSTFFQVQKKLIPDSLIIFDKGAESKHNLDLIQICGHAHLTAKKLNKSDDKIIADFWNRNPVCLNPEEPCPKKKIYGLVLPKRSSVNYLYYSAELAEENNESILRRIYRQVKEAAAIQGSIDKGKKLPKKFRLENPLIHISYSVQTKLISMSEDEAVEFLEKTVDRKRVGFFALTSSRNLTVNEALKRYREKDSVEKIFHSLKNEVIIKPLRVWTENSIRGAIIIGFLAQLFISLVRFEVAAAKHVSPKFILLSLKKLTLTVMRGKYHGEKYVYSNFEPLNMAVLGLGSG